MVKINTYLTLIIALVLFILKGNTLFAAQDNIKVYGEYELFESPLGLPFLSVDYDCEDAKITVSTFQSSALNVFIIDCDSSAVVSSHYYPEIPGYPNQSYIINAPLVPGDYIIYLTMGGSAWQGMFIVE